MLARGAKISQVPRLRTECVRFHLLVSHFGMLAYTQTRGEELSSTAPARRMCQMCLIGFLFLDAGLHPDEG
jgi:hypothetical protein